MILFGAFSFVVAYAGYWMMKHFSKDPGGVYFYVYRDGVETVIDKREKH